MGILDMFQKGGKYFGKDVPPHCEYCDFGKRAKDGNKVLCDKRGLVDADFHCGKFTYSPLKRIPVKQLNRVGFLDDENDSFDDDALDQEKTAERLNQPSNKTVAPLDIDKKPEPLPTQAAPTPAPVAAPAPAPAPTPVMAAAAPAAPVAPVVTAAPEAPAVPPVAHPVAGMDDALAAAALAAEQALGAAAPAVEEVAPPNLSQQ